MTLSTSLAATADCAPSLSQVIDADVAVALSRTMKALADPLRLRMLSAIAADPRGEACVCDLTELAKLSQPTVSHHLKVLRDSGLLLAERRGTWVYYRIAPARRAAVTTLLIDFLSSVDVAAPDLDMGTSAPSPTERGLQL